MYLPDNLIGGVKMPFDTEADLQELVGKNIYYVGTTDVQMMGNRPHVFPRLAKVLARDEKALLLDTGLWLENSEFMIVTQGPNV